MVVRVGAEMQHPLQPEGSGHIWNSGRGPAEGHRAAGAGAGAGADPRVTGSLPRAGPHHCTHLHACLELAA